jgi:NaMN:DMB phosphoribosyltransferase
LGVVSFSGDGRAVEVLKKSSFSFFLAGTTTKTCEIEGITQAGIPGLIPLTPTLDSEFLCSERVFSLKEIPKTTTGIPTPALITRAVYNLVSFESIKILDLGMRVTPKVECVESFGLKESERIDCGANIDAFEVIKKGIDYAKKVNDKFILLAESTPSGTTTAKASALALGYSANSLFSSSFKDAPTNLKDEVISKALELAKKCENDYQKLGVVSDNMLLFCAVFKVNLKKEDLLL